MGDDRSQAAAAEKLLLRAELVAITLPCLCELAWVLRAVYGVQCAEIAEAIESLIDTGTS